MLQNVFLASALLIAAVLAKEMTTCPDFIDTTAPFQTIPASNCTSAMNCTMTQCACMGGTASIGGNGEVECSAGPQQSCDFLDYCAQEYYRCLALEGSDDTCGEWSTQMKDGLLEVLAATSETLNNTLLYRSCAASSCQMLNVTRSECLTDWDPADVCFPVQGTLSPLATPAGGFTKLPRLPGGGFSVPVVRIRAILTFAGNFSAVFDLGNTSAKAVQLRTTLEETLTRLMGYPISIYAMFIGSLNTYIEAVVPASDTTTANAVYSNVQGLSSLSSSAFSDVLAECRASGGCAGGIAPPSVTGLVKTTSEASSAGPAPLTSVPRLPGGGFPVPVFIVSADLKFGGDFTATFADGPQGTAAVNMRGTLFTALTNFLDYPPDIMTMTGGAGGLDTSIEAVVPQSNGAKADDIFNRLNAKVSSRVFRVQNTLNFDQLTVSNLKKRSVGGSGTTSAVCDARCIAFIVVGIVVTVLVIIAALLIYKHRAENSRLVEPDQITPGKNEVPQNPLA
jgi:hypothetical protein